MLELKAESFHLMAARILAVGGRPLTQDEIDLCYLEAYLLEQRANELTSGLGLPGRHQALWSETAARVEAQMLHRRLSGPPGESDTHLPDGAVSAPKARL